jgi:hypothetical protein
VRGAALKNQVEVGISLRTVKRDRRPHAEDVPLKWKPRPKESRRARATDEVLDRYVANREEPGPVLECLDRPTFNAASERLGKMNPTRLRGRGESRSDHGERTDQADNGRAPAMAHDRSESRNNQSSNDVLLSLRPSETRPRRTGVNSPKVQSLTGSRHLSFSP